MDNNIFRPVNGLERSFYQMFPCLDQHLNGDIVGYMAALNQLTQNFILRFERGEPILISLYKYTEQLKTFQVCS